MTEKPPLSVQMELKLLNGRMDRLAERQQELEAGSYPTNPQGNQVRALTARVDRLEHATGVCDVVPPAPRGLSSLAPAWRRNRGFISASTIGAVIAAVVLELLRGWQPAPVERPRNSPGVEVSQ